MKVIGTVGLPGSGKGEAAAVASEMDVPVVTMGDVIREACRDRGLDPAEHHGEVARALRDEEGPAAIAERSLPMIEAALEDSDTVLVDGLRSDVELDRFRAAFGDSFRLVSVEAPFETRADRLLDRARDDTDLDRDALREREDRELGFGMDEVMDRADIVIENTDTLDAYRERIRAILDGDLDRIADSEYVDLRDSTGAPVPADHDTPGGDGR
jgi:dephospho-CoA kinase